jgi:hypothetical protein
MILCLMFKDFKLFLEISIKLTLGEFRLLVHFLINCVKLPLQQQSCGGPALGQSRVRIMLDGPNLFFRNLEDAIRVDLSLLQFLDELFDHIRTPPVRRIAGRDGGIRTHDLLVPNQALYQAEPHPDK